MDKETAFTTTWPWWRKDHKVTMLVLSNHEMGKKDADFWYIAINTPDNELLFPLFEAKEGTEEMAKQVHMAAVTIVKGTNDSLLIMDRINAKVEEITKEGREGRLPIY
ncbi:MAG: hypothetical protein UT34_C0002G0050 [candidate division WS6 bacterium GW2011_GWF2_39_15]|uniref:Uncharacterized protein n=1 Tax=candidate division WS6 bacterium GW2011_GWF2_39_15 TaxID=1619100 RepID=A0A0G0MQX9_9BACT|nr:MAG: hypothetical protein UT34_C0002G0050 [candidate division WS6 bacterium GW2011_GWF2_39_15]